MQPKTDVTFDKESFNRIKRTIRNMSLGKKKIKNNPAFAMKLPDEVGIQLTNKCNLRCRHCFQWNEKGIFKKMAKLQQNEEISFDLVNKIICETYEMKSNLYLWGGEPLCYSEFDKLSGLLEKDPRWTVFCTNGIDVESKMDPILKISGNLAMLISVEGFEDENDYVRGKGTYKKVMDNIKMLLDLKRKNVYKGEVSVNCVISEKMTEKLFDFANMFEETGVNTLYFCFPWYISKNKALMMDNFFKNNFNWLRKLDEKQKASWHSYTYQYSPNLLDKLMDEINKINNKTWKIRLRFQPALEKYEIKEFILDNEDHAQGKTKCVGITNRMNVMPDGKITICKLFPEFEIGDLNKDSVYDVWNSKDFNRAREIISCGLMPVCSKCILLYLHGV